VLLELDELLELLLLVPPDMQSPHDKRQYPTIQGSLHLPQAACCAHVNSPGGGGISTQAPGQSPHDKWQYPSIQGSLHLPQPACCSQVNSPGGGGTSTQLTGLPPEPEEDVEACPPTPPDPLEETPPVPLLDVPPNPLDEAPPDPLGDSPPDPPVDSPLGSSVVSAPHAPRSTNTSTLETAKSLEFIWISFYLDETCAIEGWTDHLYHGIRRRCQRFWCHKKAAGAAPFQAHCTIRNLRTMDGDLDAESAPGWLRFAALPTNTTLGLALRRFGTRITWGT